MRTALVTGGSAGIGRAISRRLAREGLLVVAVSNIPADLASLQEELGERCRTRFVDLSDRAQVEGLLGALEAEVGPVDVLVNNAGIGYQSTVAQANLNQVRLLFEINFFALVALCQAAVQRMGVRGSGHIVNVSSASARRGLARMSAYAASKAAVHGFTQSLRLEAARQGVKVSEVLPISVRTQFFDQAVNITGRPYQPKGLVQTPEHIADLVWRCLQRGTAEVCSSRLTGLGLALDALFPNLAARLLEWQERRGG